MTPNEQLAIDRILDAYHRGRTIVLLLDYDGTLTPIAANRHLAQLDPARRAQLAVLSAVPHIELGVVSGRTLSDVQALVGLPLLYYAGTGGMEIDLRGERIRHPAEQDAVALMYAVAVVLEPIIEACAGAGLECKPVGITIHWGEVPAHERQALQIAVRRAIEPWLDELLIVKGHHAVDLLARNGWHKGSAVDLIVAHVGARDPLVIYAGDEANDQHAFDAVHAHGGITIAVGADAPPGTAYRLATPEALGELLECLVQGLTGAWLEA